MRDVAQRERCFLLMVCETMFAERVVELMDELQVPGYTRFGGVSGVGETGRHEGTAIWPGTNTVIFTALSDEHQAALLVERIEQLIAREYARRPGFAAFRMTGGQIA